MASNIQHVSLDEAKLQMASLGTQHSEVDEESQRASRELSVWEARLKLVEHDQGQVAYSRYHDEQIVKCHGKTDTEHRGDPAEANELILRSKTQNVRPTKSKTSKVW